MGAEVSIYTGFDDFADDLREMDGAWRIGHVTLARIMKMGHPKKLAERIARHLEWLNKINRLPTVGNRPEGGGREWDEYWLDEPQCLYLLAKSDMPDANDLTVHVVRVFHRVTRGEMSLAPRMEIRALEIAAQQIVAPILAEQRKFHFDVLSRMDQTDRRVIKIEGQLVEIQRASLRFMDKPFTPRTRRIHQLHVWSQYAGMCPCCRVVQIVKENGDRLLACNDEHYGGRAKNKPHQTWITCAECNQRLLDLDYHGSKHQVFVNYQDSLRHFLSVELKKQSILF
jgi:hypothetical protein